MLIQCAWAASRKNDSYYKAQFNRLRSQRGPKKAICAVAASILTAIYHMLKDGTFHQDLGPTTSTAGRPKSKPSALSRSSLSSASRSSFSPSRRRHDVLADLRRSSLSGPTAGFIRRPTAARVDAAPSTRLVSC
jgi:hypothetical protein